MKAPKSISAVDLFCGVGGLTTGLETSGISVRLGIDIDPACKHPITSNTKAEFLQADVFELDSTLISKALAKGELGLLAGCAPCQPFSSYSQSAKRNLPSINKREDWRLVEHFGELVSETRPELVTMENVPPLAAHRSFAILLQHLRGYFVDYKVVECQKIGLPQTRKRLVLVASRLGPICLPEFDLEMRTVRSVIGDLSRLSAGESCSDDRLHRASSLSAKNLKRIRSSKPGGTWRDWPKSLRSDCHKRPSGFTYPSVYGRMSWDEPSPTITTQCFGFGNGRFGHPEQDRAISLREAAMLQGFPKNYSFIPDDENVSFSKLGRLIGNAVPVTLGEAIGRLLVDHVNSFQ
jgi:DNA (cytosine-5)-methyltransferase 1